MWLGWQTLSTHDYSNIYFARFSPLTHPYYTLFMGWYPILKSRLYYQYFIYLASTIWCWFRFCSIMECALCSTRWLSISFSSDIMLSKCGTCKCWSGTNKRLWWSDKESIDTVKGINEENHVPTIARQLSCRDLSMCISHNSYAQVILHYL